MKLTFVGEERSPTARRKDWRWQDGRLAAKQLFDALRAAGEDPAACCFLNLFERHGLAAARMHALAGDVLIAMGRRVQRALRVSRLPCIAMVHPAARGRIRRKDRYAAHVLAIVQAARGAG